MNIDQSLTLALSVYVNDRKNLKPKVALRAAVNNILDAVARHYYLIPKKQHAKGMKQILEGLDLLT